VPELENLLDDVEALISEVKTAQSNEQWSALPSLISEFNSILKGGKEVEPGLDLPELQDVPRERQPFGGLRGSADDVAKMAEIALQAVKLQNRLTRMKK
jgi:hypothetical protein